MPHKYSRRYCHHTNDDVDPVARRIPIEMHASARLPIHVARRVHLHVQVLRFGRNHGRKRAITARIRTEVSMKRVLSMTLASLLMMLTLAFAGEPIASAQTANTA